MKRKPLEEFEIIDEFDRLNEQIERLRDAIVLLANCCGAHIISQENARRLSDLLEPKR